MALQNPLVSNPPQIRFDPDGIGADVTVRLTSLGSSYCGNNLYGSGTPPVPPYGVQLYVKSGSNCPTNWSTLAKVLAHEFGHVLGFSADAHVGGYAVASHCMMELDWIQPNVNSGVCQYEVEKVYAAYGIVPLSVVSPPFDFLSKPVITGVNSPTSIGLQTGTSASVIPTQLLFARGGQQGPIPLGGTQLTWASSNENIATVSSGLVTAQPLAGTATITIMPAAASIPGTYQLGGLFRSYGQPIGVTVTIPPLGPGFIVSDIFGAPQPVTSSHDYTFGVSTVNGGNPTTLEVDWIFAPSIVNAQIDTIRTGWGPRSRTVHIYPGSYEIRVTATPRNRTSPTDPWVIGGAMIEDFPVCTGGGGQYLMAPEPGPDAVGGC